jgi:hypothetical protein
MPVGYGGFRSVYNEMEGQPISKATVIELNLPQDVVVGTERMSTFSDDATCDHGRAEHLAKKHGGEVQERSS